MTQLREAAQQALEALETWTPTFKIAIERKKEAITALRAALAGPQSTHSTECYRWHHDCAVAEVERLRAALAQRKPLTDDEIRALYDQHAAYQEEGPEASGWWAYTRAIEKAHGIE